MLAPMALLIGGSLFVAGHTLRAKSFSAQPVSATAGTARSANAPRPARIHIGVIVSMNGSPLVLRDDDDNTWYNLDDQDTAGQFSGMKVLVTGNLDRVTHMIHVEAIKPART